MAPRELGRPLGWAARALNTGLLPSRWLLLSLCGHGGGGVGAKDSTFLVNQVVSGCLLAFAPLCGSLRGSWGVKGSNFLAGVVSSRSVLALAPLRRAGGGQRFQLSGKLGLYRNAWP